MRRIPAQDFLVVKYGHHFERSFAGPANLLVADTAGLSNWRSGLFEYRHALPFYPEDNVRLKPIEARLLSIRRGHEQCSVALAQ